MDELGPDSRGQSPDVDFRLFVATRWQALNRYAYLLTGETYAAEDVVQAALERCWRRWDRITGDSPEAYVRTAIAHQAASRRRRGRLSETRLGDSFAAAAGSDHADSHALRSGLWQAMADLPPRQRAVVVLRVWEDRSEADTARVLGISAGAVKSQLSKAMAKLRAHPQVRDLAGRARIAGQLHEEVR